MRPRAGLVQAGAPAYGWPFPPVAERYALLEDALQVLPMLWGKGNPAFAGQVLTRARHDLLPAAARTGADRPRGRRGAAHPAAGRAVRRRRQRASATWRRSAARRRCCAGTAPRSGREVELTHLSTALIGADDASLTALVERLRPRTADPARFAAGVNAGTVEDHIGRFRQLAEAGVREVMIRLPDLTDAAPLERAASVISAFR